MALSHTARRIYFQLILVIGGGEMAAQDIVNMPDVTKRPTAQSVKLEMVPEIDGEVLQDEVWKTIYLV